MFSHSVMSNVLWPHGLQPTRLLYLWDFPGKNTGVGCHFLLQEILLTQGLNPSLRHCRWILYHWATGDVFKCLLTGVTFQMSCGPGFGLRQYKILFSQHPFLFPSLKPHIIKIMLHYFPLRKQEKFIQWSNLKITYLRASGFHGYQKTLLILCSNRHLQLGNHLNWK